MAHIRQSRPDSGLDFQGKFLETLQDVASWLGIGTSVLQFENNHFTEMCSGSEADSYLRLIDFCITQL